jgi:hypothetical protein
MRTGPMKEEDGMAKWRDKNWRRKQYEARKEKLPASYLEAIDTVQRVRAPVLPGHGRDRGDDARGARRDLQTPTISHAARAEA